MAFVMEIFGHTPNIAPSAWLAPSATVIGDAELGEQSCVLYGAVVRADRTRIVLGARSNLQDNVTVHCDPGFSTIIGSGVSVGHGAVLHGCTIGDDTLIGMNATVLNGAVVGSECLVAAGTVVLEGTVIPSGSLVVGVPGKVRRSLTDDERTAVRRNAETYVMLAGEHRAAVAVAAAAAAALGEAAEPQG